MMDELSVLLQANYYPEFSSYIRGEQFLVIVASVIDPDALRTHLLRHSVDYFFSYLIESLAPRIMDLRHHRLIVDADSVEFVASTDFPFTPIVDVVHALHLLRMRLCDVSKVVRDDGVLAQRRKGAENPFLHRVGNVDVFQVTAVPFGLFSNAHVCRSIEMVEDGSAVPQKSNQKFLHCLCLRHRECASERANRISHGIVDMLRCGHGEGGKSTPTAFRRPFPVNAFRHF